MTQAAHISPWLIVGAGALLFGSALAMTAALDFYERWQAGMKRTARGASFMGSAFVLVGTVANLVATEERTAAFFAVGTLAFVSLVMAGLLFLPFIAGLRARLPWCRAQLKRLATRLASLARRVGGPAPQAHDQGQGVAEAEREGRGEKVQEEEGPEEDADAEKVQEGTLKPRAA